MKDERYEVQEFETPASHNARGEVLLNRITYGVMAYAKHEVARNREDEARDIPLGIDAHWERREFAEIALDNYVHGRVAHGRTTQREHMLAFTHALEGGD